MWDRYCVWVIRDWIGISVFGLLVVVQFEVEKLKLWFDLEMRRTTFEDDIMIVIAGWDNGYM